MIFKTLKELEIDFTCVEHEAYYTMEDAVLIENIISGQMCKNLFLRNKQQYYILVVKGDKRVKLKDISKQLGIGHLYFGSEKELDALHLYSGCVNPLSVVYDQECRVKVLLDSELVDQTLLFHPNDNTKTISIVYSNLEKYITKCQHELIVLNVQ